MTRRRVPLYDPFLVNIAMYLTLGAVAITGLPALETTRSRWIAGVLLVAFGILLSLFWHTEQSERYVHLYFVAQTLIIVSLFSLQPENSQFGVLFFVLSAQVMLLLPPRTAALWIVAFILITGIGFMYFLGWIGLLWFLPNIGGYIFFATFGNLWRQAELARRRSQQLLEELQVAQRQLQDLAVVEERNRLAREMHDSLGHRLTVAIVQLEGAQRLIPTDPDRAARMIGAMREEMKEALAELRRTVTALRAPLEDADGTPLNAALARLAQTFQDSTGLAVHLDLPGALPALPEAHRLALYRAAQESLTNAQRHAAAKQVWLMVSAANGRITLTAADDGKGFGEQTATSEGGYGLRGLRERAAQLGGELVLEMRPGGGAQVRFSLPLRESPNA
jgi:signal transduction histidine kinase